jgi:hypothetical protein
VSTLFAKPTHRLFLPQCQRPSFTPVQNDGQNHSLVCSNVYVFREQMGRQKCQGFLSYFCSNQCSRYRLLCPQTRVMQLPICRRMRHKLKRTGSDSVLPDMKNYPWPTQNRSEWCCLSASSAGDRRESVPASFQCTTGGCEFAVFCLYSPQENTLHIESRTLVGFP